MKWISIDDEKPSLGKVCLLYQTYPPDTAFNCRADPLDRNFFHIGGLRYDGKFISYTDQYSTDGLKHITHWMPLPKCPKNKPDNDSEKGMKWDDDALKLLKWQIFNVIKNLSPFPTCLEKVTVSILADCIDEFIENLKNRS